MRTGSFIALVGVSALGLSGCASIEKTASGVVAATGSGGGVTTNVDPNSATGSPTGTSTGQSNSTGGTSYVYNDGGFTITGASLTEVTVSNPGGGIGTETASVSVNTQLNGLTWANPIDMALFRNTVGGVTTDKLSFAPNFTGYKEYRKIAGVSGTTTSTDAELQIWAYQFSNIGQYTVFNDPSAANANNVALFFDGAATPTSGLPAGSATYNGKFGGTGVATNWLTSTRTVVDPFDTAGTVGSTYDPNGTWRVVGDVQVNANFGSGAVTGSVTNTTWRKFTGSATSQDGFITVTPAETAKPYIDYTFSGTITDNTFAGNVQGPAGGVVTGNNAINGGFFGPNAEEVAGVLNVETTAPTPSDGVTANDSNRRGFINLRGVFQGNR